MTITCICVLYRTWSSVSLQFPETVAHITRRAVSLQKFSL